MTLPPLRRLPLEMMSEANNMKSHNNNNNNSVQHQHAMPLMRSVKIITPRSDRSDFVTVRIACRRRRVVVCSAAVNDDEFRVGPNILREAELEISREIQKKLTYDDRHLSNYAAHLPSFASLHSAPCAELPPITHACDDDGDDDVREKRADALKAPVEDVADDVDANIRDDDDDDDDDNDDSNEASSITSSSSSSSSSSRASRVAATTKVRGALMCRRHQHPNKMRGGAPLDPVARRMKASCDAYRTPPHASVATRRSVGVRGTTTTTKTAQVPPSRKASLHRAAVVGDEEQRVQHTRRAGKRRTRATTMAPSPLSSLAVYLPPLKRTTKA